jgi:dephospho-CoA kinase
MKRDSSSREEASSRLNSQLSITEKVEYADYVIDNSGSFQDLEGQVHSFLEKIDKEVGRVWWRLSWLIPPFGVLSAILVLAWRAVWRWKKKLKS